ncbi:MAG: hypothetical protein QM813_26505 [Verrucomicrobiota bacterium]
MVSLAGVWSPHTRWLASLDVKGLGECWWRHRGCFAVGMITGCCIFFAFLAAGFFMEMTAVASAPLGYQDAGGFHFGRPTAASVMAWELENPS